LHDDGNANFGKLRKLRKLKSKKRKFGACAS
jgi:hypothetical protein